MTREYVKALVEAYPAISEVWLLGSRANDESHEGSDWDYLAYGGQGVFDALRADERLREKKMDLMVLYDGDNFKEPWHVKCPKRGSLSGWKFEFESEGIASYESVKDLSDGSLKIETKRAVRVWPPTLNEQGVAVPS